MLTSTSRGVVGRDRLSEDSLPSPASRLAVLRWKLQRTIVANHPRPEQCLRVVTGCPTVIDILYEPCLPSVSWLSCDLLPPMGHVEIAQHFWSYSAPQSIE